MFTDHARLLDRFDPSVVSFAILGDGDAGWRPDGWRSELLGCSVAFDFPAITLLDDRDPLTALTADRNPFATVVLAHLQALATRRDASGRRRAKVVLIRRLYDLEYDREAVIAPLPTDQLAAALAAGVGGYVLAGDARLRGGTSDDLRHQRGAPWSPRRVADGVWRER
jgi:hypothetical protein